MENSFCNAFTSFLFADEVAGLRNLFRFCCANVFGKRLLRELESGACWNAPNGGLTKFSDGLLLVGLLGLLLVLLFILSEVRRPGMAISFLSLFQNGGRWLITFPNVPEPGGKGNLRKPLGRGGGGGNLGNGGLFLNINLLSLNLATWAAKKKN